MEKWAIVDLITQVQIDARNGTFLVKIVAKTSFFKCLFPPGIGFTSFDKATLHKKLGVRQTSQFGQLAFTQTA